MQRRSSVNPRLIMGFIVALVAVFSYCNSRQVNPITGQVQAVALQPDQEIALGLQAAPQMIEQYGGESRDSDAVARVDRIGERLIERSAAKKSEYKFDFHVLADRKTINAFALPGGQVFITEALLSKLPSDAAVAGVLGHEIGHVIARHGAQRLAKQNLTQGLAGAATIATYDPNNPESARNGMIAQAIGSLVNLKYSREDELESDTLGVRFISESGYDPRAQLKVMDVLKSAGGGARQPEFFATHPNPENRSEKIRAAIEKLFPNGVPENLEK